MKWYDLHELLTFAVPIIPIERSQPMRLDRRGISHDPVAVDRESARLFGDARGRVDLRDLCRTVAPWFRRPVKSGDTLAILAPCDGDEWFREACHWVNEWLARPCDYLHREDVASLLGPYAALECARQCSPDVAAMLVLPEVAPLVAAFERGDDVDQRAASAAHGAMAMMYSGWATTIVGLLLTRSPDWTFASVKNVLVGQRRRAEEAAEKREKPPA